MAAGKIDRIELFHVDIPLPTPFFPAWIPGYPQNRLRYTLLRVTTRDGLVGHATGAAFDRERGSLGDFIGPFLLGIDPYDVRAASDRLRQASFLGWRNSWMELAFWDLAAKRKGVPLWSLLSSELEIPAVSPALERVPAYASFGEHRPPRVRAEAIERAQDMGFRAAKLTLRAVSEAEDVSELRAAREVAGAGFGLMVHAHQAWNVTLMQEVPAWDLGRALRFAEAASIEGVSWLQEPLHGEAWDAMSELSRASRIPIAGGDIAPSLAPLRALAEHGCYTVLTPDVTFCGMGGLVKLLRLLHERRLGYSPHSYGDGIGLAANLHALVAWSRLGNTRAPQWLEFPWEPPAIIPEIRDAILEEPIGVERDGNVMVPTGPGLGVEIDAKALRRWGERFYVQTPVRFLVSSARQRGLKQTAAFVEAKRQSGPRRRKVVTTR